MYKIIAIMFLSAMIYMTVPASKSEARTVCSKNALGQTVCTDDSGNTMTGQRNVLGQDVWNDNRGKQTRCYYNALRQYVCD
jgi:hypothetical protein